MLSRSTVALGVVACASAAACSGSAASPAAAPAAEAHESSATRPPKPVPRTEMLAAAQVFDEKGNAAPCGPPQSNCPAQPPASDFLDRCRLAGHQVLQCGCELRCTGNVAAASKHYDASGQPKDCAPARADCTPPQASAAFQDACTERGFRLDVCGCEWLCSGDLKR